MLIQDLLSLTEGKDDPIPLSRAEEISKKLRDAHGSIKSDAHYEKVLKRLEQQHGKEVADAFDRHGDDSGDKLHYQQKLSKPHQLLIKKHKEIASTVLATKPDGKSVKEALTEEDHYELTQAGKLLKAIDDLLDDVVTFQQEFETGGKGLSPDEHDERKKIADHLQKAFDGLEDASENLAAAKKLL